MQALDLIYYGRETMKRLCDKQTDLLTPDGVRDPIDSVSRVSGEQIRLLSIFPKAQAVPDAT